MKLTKEGRNIMMAMLIGDGHITKQGILIVEHGLKQKKYCEWKYNLIKKYIKSNKSTNLNKSRWNTKASKFGRFLRKYIGVHPKKITKKILNRIGVLGLAIWYMDDGTLDLRKNKNRDKIRGRCASLRSHWKYDNALLIKDWFKDTHNLKLKLKLNKKNGLYWLEFTSLSTVDFFNLIKPYIHESMFYKICPRFFNNKEKIKNNLCESQCSENCPYKLNHLFCRPK